MEEERILNLPVEDYPPDGVLQEKWSKRLQRRRRVSRNGKGVDFASPSPELFPDQARACECISRAPTRRGAVLSIKVGGGKTLISLLAGTILGAKKVLILLPARLRDQNLRDQKEWSPKFRVHPEITLLSYEMLSRPESADLLEELDADLVILDEAHNVASFKSARTKRVFRFFKDRPDCRAIVMSGTLTSKSLNDFSHLVELALRDGSPIPTSYYVRERWAAVIDSRSEFSSNDWAQIRWMVDKKHWNSTESERQKHARLAFQKRFQSTPGIIVSRDRSIGCSLVYTPWDPSPSPKITDALAEVRRTWTLPDGTELVTAIEWTRALKQISLGFFYRWVWPDGEPDWEWLEARRAWHATARNVISLGKRGMDSPARVNRQAEQGNLSRAVLEVWDRWEAQKHKDPPPTESVWICESVIRQIVSHTKDRRAIIWYQSIAVGEKLEEMGIPLGIPDRSTLCALSISKFGEGVDGLQYLFSDQLIVESPSSGRRWEQTVGRTHRHGQEAHTVEVEWALLPPFSHAFQRAITDAEYIFSTTGSRQKLLYGTHANPWDPDLTGGT